MIRGSPSIGAGIGKIQSWYGKNSISLCWTIRMVVCDIDHSKHGPQSNVSSAMTEKALESAKSLQRVHREIQQKSWGYLIIPPEINETERVDAHAPIGSQWKIHHSAYDISAIIWQYNIAIDQNTRWKSSRATLQRFVNREKQDGRRK